MNAHADITEQQEAAQALHDFKAAVNMSAKALEDWLATDASREVGWTHEGSHESVGHQSGRHIVRLLKQDPLRADGLSNADVAHMKKVVGYVHRHLAQRPKGDIRDTAWRYSLMNWGHDPLKA